MNWLATFLPLLLQSNEMLARAVASHGGLQPDLSQYYTSFTGYFGAFFLSLITALATVVHDYGLAIILSVIVVRIMLLPLTRQQIRGMKVMQMLQPVMKSIQTYYPDKQDQSAKMMELYSVYKVNPLAGCLPMLIQFPILIGVYRALYDISFAGKSFLGVQLLFPVNLTAARSFSKGPDLSDIIDVTVSKLGLQHMIWNIPENVPLIGGGHWYLPAMVLVLLYVASTFLMQRVMRKVNAPHPEFEAEFKAEVKTREGEAPQQDLGQQMQKQMGMMNILILILAFIFSSGALLYFIMQNLLMLVEYTFLPRGMQLAFDAKEMKAFILRPPPPMKGAQASSGQRGPEPPKPAARAKGVDSAAADTKDALNQEDGQQDGQGLDESLVALQRPRRKRKKR